MIHCNKSNDKLQLQVDIFCTDIINGARQWLSEINEDDQRHERIQNLLKIYLPDSDGNIKF
jgi:Ca2+-binding EF-hand superfamily protein